MNNAESKVQAVAHAKAIGTAAEFFAALAKRGQLPLTEGEFSDRVNEFYRRLEAKLKLSNALLLAILSDQPCPQGLFAPWASTGAIAIWRKAEKNPLPPCR
jgi:hypothetical protein